MSLPMIESVPARRTAAALCIAMLLVASSVQVMHHCTALDAGAAHHATGDSLSSSPLFCNVCMTVQVAAMAVIVLVLAMGKVRLFTPALPSLFLPDAAPAFSLYVRPPPVQFL